MNTPPAMVKKVRFFEPTFRRPFINSPQKHEKAAEVTLDWFNGEKIVQRRIYVSEARGIEFVRRGW